MTFKIPGNNKFVDDQGRILPHWLPAFSVIQKLSVLTADQLTTLTKLVQSLSKEGSNVSLNEDGTLTVATEASTVTLDIQDDGQLVASQESDPSLLIDFGKGLHVDGLTVSAVPVLGNQNVTGWYRAYMGAAEATAGGVSMVANRIYAQPFQIPERTLITNAGPNFLGFSHTSTVSIHTSADRGFGPGKKIYFSPMASRTTPWGDAPNITLSPGLYWVCWGSTLATGCLGVTNMATGSGGFGFVDVLGDLRPVHAFYRDETPPISLDDESGSVWNACYNGGPVAPFMTLT